MDKVFSEENGAYRIDCTNALWATDQIHKEYQNANIHINDVDFAIEDSRNIVLVEV